MIGMTLQWMFMTSYKRGDIVIVLFPFGDLFNVKRRPALVVQADSLKTDLDKLIIAQISSNTARASYPSRVSVKLNSALAAGTNLKQDSVIFTDILTTVDTSIIEKKIGAMPSMAEVDVALKKALSLETDNT